MNVEARQLELHLRHTFRISRWGFDVARTLLVTLEHAGLTGFGEAAPPRFFGEDLEATRRALEGLGGRLEGDPAALDAVLDALPPQVAALHGATAALDIALHDLAGQLAGQPLWAWLGLDPSAAPATSFTIAIAPVEQMVAHVREAERYPLLKIKVGTGRDVPIIEAIRSVTDKPLRVDANAAWSPQQAIAHLRAIQPYGIEFVEQPIPPGDPEAMRRVREAVDVPIIADESVATADDIPPLADAVDGVNIKLMKCGGIREARKMIDLARSLGLKVMLGCHIESSVAITAAAHLAPLADYADLDGNVLVVDDPFEGATLDDGARLCLPRRPGLGVRPRQA
ncbi:MAG: dipeptide epimerase [Candidatus Brocadiia bacterium]